MVSGDCFRRTDDGYRSRQITKRSTGVANPAESAINVNRRDPVNANVMPQESMPNPIDWKSVEDTLVRLASATIANFAAVHGDEQFYAFAFDCNADYGQAMPCLNTPEHHELAIDGKHLSPEITDGYEKMRAEMGLPPKTEKPRDERAKSLRWSLGDWKYQDFSDQAYEDGWESPQELVSDACSPDFDEFDDDDAYDQHVESVRQTFLNTVCRALIQLENSQAFDSLNRTDDFQACVIDHDEDVEDGWARLKSVRGEA
jgi:hypothetical protein